MRVVLSIVSFWQHSGLDFLPTFANLATGANIQELVNLLTNDGYRINWQAVYLAGTLIVGLLIAYESLVLKKNFGKLPQSTLFSISSILETVWLLVSIAAIYYGNFSALNKVVPMAYIIYSIFGWLYGFYLLKDQADSIKDVDDMKMPAKYMDYSLSFSLVITLTSVVVFIGMLVKGVITLTIA